MKTCFKCNKEKPLSAFYKHKQMADSHLNKCKECTKLDSKNNRDKNIDYYREYDKKRSKLPHRIEKTTAYTKEYRKIWPYKYAANNIINNMIRDGKLLKKPCEVCGSEDNLHAHHDDYGKPLEIRWLCAICHSDWHKHNQPLYPNKEV